MPFTHCASVCSHVDTVIYLIGSHIYAIDGDSSCIGYSVRDGSVHARYTVDSTNQHVTITTDNKYLLAAGNGSARMFDTTTHKQIHEYTSLPNDISCITYSADNQYILAAGASDRYISLYAVNTANNKVSTTRKAAHTFNTTSPVYHMEMIKVCDTV